jgi:hypothetical protein
VSTEDSFISDDTHDDTLRISRPLLHGPLLSSQTQSMMLRQVNSARVSGRNIRRQLKVSCSAEPGPSKPTVAVCYANHCKKKGAALTFSMLRDLADGNAVIRQTSCLDECPSGPNVGLCDEADIDDHDLMPIVNNVKTETDVRDLLARIGVKVD